MKKDNELFLVLFFLIGSLFSLYFMIKNEFGEITNEVIYIFLLSLGLGVFSLFIFILISTTRHLKVFIKQRISKK